VSDTSSGREPDGRRRSGGAPFTGALPPFARLARTHALMVAGDATVAIALAGSLFFSIDPSQARWRVALYLLFTVAPFTIVAPLLGPAIDRIKGGRRMMVVVIAAGRVVVSLLMAVNLDSLLLFPLAFVALVLGKAYTVAKSAIVPTVVRREEELVEANAKLGTVAGVVGFAAAIPALLLSLIGPSATVVWSSAYFALAAVSARSLPRAAIAPQKATAAEQAELHSTAILLGASGMTLLRASSGFLTFFLAFWLRDEGAPTAFFGLVLAASAIGTLIGNVSGPQVRRVLREELMMLAAMVGVGVVGILAALVLGRLTAAVVAFVVGLACAVARLGFDAMVQRDAPDANQGRAFAQFEARFQLAWVLAAFVPVAIPLPGALGFLIVGVLGLVGASWYLMGMRSLRVSGRLPTPVGRRVGRYLHQRRAARSARPDATPPAGSSGSTRPPPPPDGVWAPPET
jgi:MFS family permease